MAKALFLNGINHAQGYPQQMLDKSFEYLHFLSIQTFLVGQIPICQVCMGEIMMNHPWFFVASVT
jgi:hypothetical protein